MRVGQPGTGVRHPGSYPVYAVASVIRVVSFKTSKLKAIAWCIQVELNSGGGGSDFDLRNKNAT